MANERLNWIPPNLSASEILLILADHWEILADGSDGDPEGVANNCAEDVRELAARLEARKDGPQ